MAAGFAFSFSGAFAQSPEQLQQDASARAKVKIVKKIDSHYYILDTTLTIQKGETWQGAVKQLNLNAGTLLGLGAKRIEPAQVTTFVKPDILIEGYSNTYDSIRAVVYRVLGADSLLRHTVRGLVFRRGGEHEQWQTLRDSSRMLALRHPLVIRQLIKSDSLLRNRAFIRLDSSGLVPADTFLLREKVRIEADGEGRVRVLRLQSQGAAQTIETGDYEMIRVPAGNSFHIILRKAPLKGAKAKATQKQNTAKEVPAKTVQRQVKVFPNPTSGVVQLSFEVPQKDEVMVRVVNSAGKTVVEEEHRSFKGLYQKEINLGKYGRGLYVIQIRCGKTIQAEKVLVQ
ncbi:T9SS type A sorting domain-containing protein [Rufibacter quisquiliarum]|uniref:Secretion system C-terminal sorting domain-containing protein n=1 Tax=Rufibacter quisquiliarum TaxID=1549639 RepID=A0A839GM91_9BACT|nr:hypothetical protein [Rufibacter quisquiliarum]